MAFQVHFGPFSEEQQDKIMEVLTNMFRCRHSKVMKLHSVIANNSGYEPAVGTRFHNKMSVNMATDFIKKCMEKLLFFGHFSFNRNNTQTAVTNMAKQRML